MLNRHRLTILLLAFFASSVSHAAAEATAGTLNLIAGYGPHQQGLITQEGSRKNFSPNSEIVKNSEMSLGQALVSRPEKQGGFGSGATPINQLIKQQERDNMPSGALPIWLQYSLNLLMDTTIGDKKRIDDVSSSLTKYLAYCVPGKDLWSDKNLSPRFPSKECSPALLREAKVNAYPIDAAFRLSTLVQPLTYPYVKELFDGTGDKGYAPALDFIRYLSGMTQAIKPPKAIEELPEKIDEEKFSSLSSKPFLIQRSRMAKMSVMADNLLHMYAERLPTIDNKVAQLPDTSVYVSDGKVSPLAIEHYMATHRVADPTWHDAMERAIPITVQREQLYVAAAQLHEMYLLRQSIERLNLSMISMKAGISAGAAK